MTSSRVVFSLTVALVTRHLFFTASFRTPKETTDIRAEKFHSDWRERQRSVIGQVTGESTNKRLYTGLRCSRHPYGILRSNIRLRTPRVFIKCSWYPRFLAPLKHSNTCTWVGWLTAVQNTWTFSGVLRLARTVRFLKRCPRAGHSLDSFSLRVVFQ